ELYGTGARLYGKLRLDKNGLVGIGRIEYLSSSSESDAYTLYPDSATATGRDYVIGSGTINGVSYPDITASQFRMNWKAKEDKMYVYNLDEPFDLYNNTASLDGHVIHGKSGVKGHGKFEARGFEVLSRDYTFEQNEMLARHSNFRVASANSTKPLMSGRDIRLDFDLTA